MPTGSLSRLGYANRLQSTVAAQITAGLPTIGFPGMARAFACGGRDGLREHFQALTRGLWIVVAPIVVSCVVLARPICEALFRRGAFTLADAESVAAILQAYSLGLAAACFGVLLSRAAYVLGHARAVAVIGVVEVAFYAIVLPVLSRSLGLVGVALAMAALLNAGALSNFVLLRVVMGRGNWLQMVVSLLLTAAIACAAGGAAWLVARAFLAAWTRTVAGGVVVVAVYAVLMLALRPAELSGLRAFLKVAPTDADGTQAA
jgi:putative peptidoglycan lipid II flippase